MILLFFFLSLLFVCDLQNCSETGIYVHKSAKTANLGYGKCFTNFRKLPATMGLYSAFFFFFNQNILMSAFPPLRYHHGTYTLCSDVLGTFPHKLLTGHPHPNPKPELWRLGILKIWGWKSLRKKQN